MLSYKELNNQLFTGINSYITINNNSFNNNNLKIILKFCRFLPINKLEISRTNNKSCVEKTSKKDILIIADTKILNKFLMKIAQEKIYIISLLVKIYWCWCFKRL